MSRNFVGSLDLLDLAVVMGKEGRGKIIDAKDISNKDFFSCAKYLWHPSKREIEQE